LKAIRKGGMAERQNGGKGRMAEWQNGRKGGKGN